MQMPLLIYVVHTFENLLSCLAKYWYDLGIVNSNVAYFKLIFNVVMMPYHKFSYYILLVNRVYYSLNFSNFLITSDSNPFHNFYYFCLPNFQFWNQFLRPYYLFRWANLVQNVTAALMTMKATAKIPCSLVMDSFQEYIICSFQILFQSSIFNLFLIIFHKSHLDFRCTIIILDCQGVTE